MMILNRLSAVLVAAVVLLPAPLALEARTRKGDRLLAQGRQAEVRKEFDKALELFEQALSTDPMDAAYQLAVNRVRFQAGQMHVQRGKTLRDARNFEGALIEFQQAYAIDPSSTVAEQELRRTMQMIEREKLRKEEPGEDEERTEDRTLSAAQFARREAEDRAASIRAVPELRPITPDMNNLKIVNQAPKVIFETIGKLAGINVLFDSEYQDQGRRYSIDLARTTLAEALDYVALLTKSFWKPLSPNAIFVANDNVTKRRDYEEHVTRVFYLQNITTPQELQEVMTAMRQVTDVRKIFPYNSQSALVVRGTADQMALAEKVILDLDKPKPEVVVDVLVMEASRSVTRDLGFGLTGGINVPISFTPGGQQPSTGTGANTTQTSITLNRLGNLSSRDWSVVLPNGAIQALLSDGQTRVLQAPQVRATDGQKASLRLGDRYPYATGSFQPGVGAVGVSPLVSTQFQFADVGVNVDVTPRIHGTEEVSMQVELEISNIRERINVGGLEQPVIGQRKVQHIIRVREGQATLIGGLMQASDRSQRTGVPGLMQIPGLGRLFSTERVERSNNDLLVVLVPHIVRYPEIQPENLRAVASGTETIYKISFTPRAAAGVPAVGPARPELAEPKPAVPPAAVEPKPEAAAPEPAKPEAAPPVEPKPEEAKPAEPAPAQPQASQPRVVIVPSTTEPRLNALVTVNINIENALELFSAPMRLAFDEKVLKLLEIRRGAFLGGDGAQVTFNQTRVESPGGAIVGINRVAGAGGISGSGTLVTLVFQAVGRGATTIAFSELTLRDAKLQGIQVQPPVASISVK